MNSELRYYPTAMPEPLPLSDPFPTHPQEIYDELRQTIVGQDEAIREIAVALVKHFVGHPAGNILLIGNSGTGKTTLIRAIERLIAARADLSRYSNVIRINANVLGEEREGYGRAVLGRLYRNARKTLGTGASLEQLVRRVERGIVFIDEIDKIRGYVGSAPNVKGIVAQEALLTLMENEQVEFRIDEPVHATLSVNSASILFIAAGAFEEMYDSVLRRATIGAEVEPLKPVVIVSQGGEVREELPFHLRNYFRYEDLFQYGMSPQFVSRFESVVVFNQLTEHDLARIFVEAESSIFRTAREYFQRFGVDLQITRQAIWAIAWEASRQNRLGARALKEVFRKVIRQLEFDPTHIRGRTLTIDDEMVRQALS